MQVFGPLAPPVLLWISILLLEEALSPLESLTGLGGARGVLLFPPYRGSDLLLGRRPGFLCVSGARGCLPCVCELFCPFW